MAAPVSSLSVLVIVRVQLRLCGFSSLYRKTPRRHWQKHSHYRQAVSRQGIAAQPESLLTGLNMADQCHQKGKNKDKMTGKNEKEGACTLPRNINSLNYSRRSEKFKVTRMNSVPFLLCAWTKIAYTGLINARSWPQPHGKNMTTITPDQLKRAFGAFPTGVTVVTANTAAGSHWALRPVRLLRYR